MARKRKIPRRQVTEIARLRRWWINCWGNPQTPETRQAIADTVAFLNRERQESPELVEMRPRLAGPPTLSQLYTVTDLATGYPGSDWETVPEAVRERFGLTPDTFAALRRAGSCG